MYQVFCMKIGYKLYVPIIFRLSTYRIPNHSSIKLVTKQNRLVLCILLPLIKQFFQFGQSCGHKNKHSLAMHFHSYSKWPAAFTHLQKVNLHFSLLKCFTLIFVLSVHVILSTNNLPVEAKNPYWHRDSWIIVYFNAGEEWIKYGLLQLFCLFFFLLLLNRKIMQICFVFWGGRDQTLMDCVARIRLLFSSCPRQFLQNRSITCCVRSIDVSIPAEKWSFRRGRRSSDSGWKVAGFKRKHTCSSWFCGAEPALLLDPDPRGRPEPGRTRCPLMDGHLRVLLRRDRKWETQRLPPTGETGIRVHI